MPHPQPDFPLPDPAPAGILDRALDLVRFLRANCPWDAAQTPRSLVPFLLEEAHEAADAAARGDDGELADELGDLLLNVAFQIVLAEERGAFSAARVAAGLEQKMRRRHPHLWGDGPAEDWAEIKRRERGAEPGGVLDGIGTGTSPLLRAQQMQQRVAEVGFDWPGPEGALEKVREEIDEVAAELAHPTRLADELGDLLFSVVNVARLTRTDANVALMDANAKFARRFHAVEEAARARGIRLSEAGLDVLDTLWSEAKQKESADS